jgi:hypothetical protein
MKVMVKVLVPVSFAFAALGAQAAGTVETDYPMNLQATASSVSASSGGEPHLVQSNNEGVRETTAAASGLSQAANAPTTRSGMMSGVRSNHEKGAADLGYFA